MLRRRGLIHRRRMASAPEAEVSQEKPKNAQSPTPVPDGAGRSDEVQTNDTWRKTRAGDPRGREYHPLRPTDETYPPSGRWFLRVGSSEIGPAPRTGHPAKAGVQPAMCTEAPDLPRREPLPTDREREREPAASQSTERAPW